MGKIEALAQYLEVSVDKVDKVDYDENTFEIDGDQYQVYTDSEAYDATYERIKDEVWSFNADFLADMTGFDIIIFEALQDKCEDSNDAVLKLIEKSCGLDDFVGEAVLSDGRGHFLSGYDGDEIELFGYFAYRIN